jgi:hypothetical protein
MMNKYSTQPKEEAPDPFAVEIPPAPTAPPSMPPLDNNSTPPYSPPPSAPGPVASSSALPPSAPVLREYTPPAAQSYTYVSPHTNAPPSANDPRVKDAIEYVEFALTAMKVCSMLLFCSLLCMPALSNYIITSFLFYHNSSAKRPADGQGPP